MQLAAAEAAVCCRCRRYANTLNIYYGVMLFSSAMFRVSSLVDFSLRVPVVSVRRRVKVVKVWASSRASRWGYIGPGVVKLWCANGPSVQHWTC